jgi:hypothetical protein
MRALIWCCTHRDTAPALDFLPAGPVSSAAFSQFPRPCTTPPSRGGSITGMAFSGCAPLSNGAPAIPLRVRVPADRGAGVGGVAAVPAGTDRRRQVRTQGRAGAGQVAHRGADRPGHIQPGPLGVRGRPAVAAAQPDRPRGSGGEALQRGYARRRCRRTVQRSSELTARQAARPSCAVSIGITAAWVRLFWSELPVVVVLAWSRRRWVLVRLPFGMVLKCEIRDCGRGASGGRVRAG